MGDFANIINRLGEVRDILATNIAAHGVTVTEGSSISTLATRVCAIDSGIRHIRTGYQLFMNNTEMTELPASLDVERLDSLYKMCYGCTALTRVGELRTAGISDLRWIFYGCSALESIDGLDTDSITSATEMFHGCTSLVTIYNDLNFSNVTEKIDDTFVSCKSLVEVRFAGTINVDIAMNGCAKLSVDSLLSLLNALCENGQGLKCKIGTTNLGKLTDAQKAIATDKGWELV